MGWREGAVSCALAALLSVRLKNREGEAVRKIIRVYKSINFCTNIVVGQSRCIQAVIKLFTSAMHRILSFSLICMVMPTVKS